VVSAAIAVDAAENNVHCKHCGVYFRSTLRMVYRDLSRMLFTQTDLM